LRKAKSPPLPLTLATGTDNFIAAVFGAKKRVKTSTITRTSTIEEKAKTSPLHTDTGNRH
jgi:hypothetical protein